jgi:hypothetical protein
MIENKESNNNSELIESSNGFQNIGIMKKFISKNEIPRKYRMLFLDIVEYSFGYCKTHTKPYSMKKWSELLDITIPTFNSHIKWLEKNNFIKVTKATGFVKGGGSEANKYSPIFPNNGNIYIDKLVSGSIATKEINKIYEHLSSNQKDNIAKQVKKINKQNRETGFKTKETTYADIINKDISYYRKYIKDENVTFDELL